MHGHLASFKASPHNAWRASRPHAPSPCRASPQGTNPLDGSKPQQLSQVVQRMDQQELKQQSSLAASLLNRLLGPSSVRQPKNPKDFKSMDELREHLHNSHQGSTGFAGFINAISSSSFGEDDKVNVSDCSGAMEVRMEPAVLHPALTCNESNTYDMMIHPCIKLS